MMYGCKTGYRILSIIVLILVTVSPLAGQKEKKYTRQGNKDYSDNNFMDSEILYRRAIDVDPLFNKAVFNLGDALYKQEKYEEAVDRFAELSQKEMNKEGLAGSYYNLGNSLLKSGKIEESIEAYKNALRNNPGNLEAKYNLAYAQDLLNQQQQQQNKDQKQDQNEDQQNDQQKDQQPGSDENKEDQEEQGQPQDKEQDDQQQENQNSNQQEQQPQMSREDAERLLQALAENEKEVQEKVKKAKAAQARVRTLKNW